MQNEHLRKICFIERKYLINVIHFGITATVFTCILTVNFILTPGRVFGDKKKIGGLYDEYRKY